MTFLFHPLVIFIIMLSGNDDANDTLFAYDKYTSFCIYLYSNAIDHTFGSKPLLSLFNANNNNKNFKLQCFSQTVTN